MTNGVTLLGIGFISYILICEFEIKDLKEVIKIQDKTINEAIEIIVKAKETKN